MWSALVVDRRDLCDLVARACLETSLSRDTAVPTPPSVFAEGPALTDVGFSHRVSVRAVSTATEGKVIVAGRCHQHFASSLNNICMRAQQVKQ